MGFCAMFPWLCGIGKLSAELAEFSARAQQLVLPITSQLEAILAEEKDVSLRMMRIEQSRAEATALLAAEGINPYAA